MSNYTKRVYIRTLERVRRHRLAGYPVGRGYVAGDLAYARYIRLTDNALAYW